MKLQTELYRVILTKVVKEDEKHISIKSGVTTLTRTQNSAMLQSVSHGVEPPYNFSVFV